MLPPIEEFINLTTVYPLQIHDLFITHIAKILNSNEDVLKQVLVPENPDIVLELCQTADQFHKVIQIQFTYWMMHSLQKNDKLALLELRNYLQNKLNPNQLHSLGTELLEIIDYIKLNMNFTDSEVAKAIDDLQTYLRTSLHKADSPEPQCPPTPARPKKSNPVRNAPSASLQQASLMLLQSLDEPTWTLSQGPRNIAALVQQYGFKHPRPQEPSEAAPPEKRPFINPSLKDSRVEPRLFKPQDDSAQDTHYTVTKIVNNEKLTLKFKKHLIPGDGWCLAGAVGIEDPSKALQNLKDELIITPEIVIDQLAKGFYNDLISNELEGWQEWFSSDKDHKQQNIKSELERLLTSRKDEDELLTYMSNVSVIIRYIDFLLQKKYLSPQIATAILTHQARGNPQYIGFVVPGDNDRIDLPDNVAIDDKNIKWVIFTRDPQITSLSHYDKLELVEVKREVAPSMASVPHLLNQSRVD